MVWAVTSSALRAPPMMLLGKYVPPAGVPWVSTLSLVGLGLAGATAPYLTLGLRGVDPRLPFALASLALVAAVGGMLWAEKHLAAAAPAEPPPPARPLDSRVVAFFAAVALLGLGFQMHFALNSAPLYLRFAKPPELDHLMPVFWIGFNLLIFPACRANQRFGGVPVMTAGAVLGALAASLAASAPSLEILVVLQFLAGRRRQQQLDAHPLAQLVERGLATQHPVEARPEPAHEVRVDQPPRFRITVLRCRTLQP